MEEIDFRNKLSFLNKLENDLTQAFVHLCSNKKYKLKNDIDIKHLLRKSNDFIKGDYFLCLRSIDATLSQSFMGKLIDKLNEIQYISESKISDSKSLILCLNRSMVYRYVLNQVMEHKENYGMLKLNQHNLSYLIIVHNEINNCNALRVAIIADHLISFLKLNGAEVNTSDFCKYSKVSLKKSSLVCDTNCNEDINMVSELLVNSAKTCEWSEDLDGKSVCVAIDGKNFFKRCPLSFKFGNDVNLIKIFDSKSEIIRVGAYAIHFSKCHSLQNNVIFHISLQSQKHKIIESGLLIEMLGFIDSPQSFFDCQKVFFKNGAAVSIETFLEYQNQEILRAMSHKYSSAALSNNESKHWMETLVDTAVKFIFLKTGASSPLKIDYSNNCNSQKNNGIFIQYNFARLCNLLKEFELKVQKGIYDALPSMDEIDFKLLKSDEEWNLLNFVLSFPRLIEDIFYALSCQKSTFHSNRICIMLIELCHLFSLYYSRVRILVNISNPKSQLQKIMHARLWLLKGIHQIMCNSFALINVQGIKQM